MANLSIEPGLLRHRITIQKRADTQDSFGQLQPSWTTFATVRASVKPLSGSEVALARELTANASHKITIRYRPGITAKMRIVWGARLFDINYVSNTDERNALVDLTCSESV